MKKIIVTTTINKPTQATLKFCSIKDWSLIIVGDKKTPHDDYFELQSKFSNVKYMHPDEQEKKYKKISDLIGWNYPTRRNIGFIEAYNLGADVVATVDDDNIPYDDWGQNLLINKEIEVDTYKCDDVAFDPFSVTNNSHLWQRGYPIELLKTKNDIEYYGKIKRKVLVQADFADGDPDIDAMARLTYKPSVKFNIDNPYCSNKIAPFNSQNTFISREVLPHYCVLPHCGRMDDIWGSYLLQHYFPESVVYNKSSVCQVRNEHDLVKDLELEIIGYRNSFKLLNDLSNFVDYIPSEASKFYRAYTEQFNEGVINE